MSTARRSKFYDDGEFMGYVTREFGTATGNEWNPKTPVFRKADGMFDQVAYERWLENLYAQFLVGR